MGDDVKTNQASFLVRRTAPVQSLAPETAPKNSAAPVLPATASQSVAALPKGSIASIPSAPSAPPASNRPPAPAAGKLSALLKQSAVNVANGPRMSAIRAPSPSSIGPLPAISQEQRVTIPLPPAVAAAISAPKLQPVAVPAANPGIQGMETLDAARVAPAKESARHIADRLLQRGLDNYDRGEFNQALDTYDEAIEADPTFAMAYNNKGMVLIDLDRHEEALAALNESISCDPKYGEAYNNLGFVMRRLGDDLQAAAAYQRFLELEPDVEEGERIRGWIDTVKSEHGVTELPAFVAALPPKPAAAPAPKKAPDLPKVQKMAAWEAAAGNTAMAAPVDALGEFSDDEQIPVAKPMTAVIPLAGNSVRSGTFRAMNSGTFRPGNSSGTLAAPNLSGKQPKLVPALPVSPEESRNRIIAFVESSLDKFAEGNLEEALRMAHQALDLDPDCSEVHTALGKIYVRQEKLDEGIEHLEKAIQLCPSDPAAYYVLGFTLRAMERNVEAAEIYEKFLALMPDALDAPKMRQWIQHVKGIGEAEARPDLADDPSEENVPVTCESDQLYVEALEKFRSATAADCIQACEHILAADPDHVRTLVLLGRALMRESDFDNAALNFQRAYELDPSNGDACFFQGQCAEKSGDSPRALKLYRRYSENFPTGKHADKLRAWFLAHGVGEGGRGLNEQIQCEWCLRFFAENQVSLHETKATCNECLTLMGSTPIQSSSALEALDPAEAARLHRIETRKGRSFLRKLAAPLAGLGTVAALVALGYFTPYLDPVLTMAGIRKPPTVVKAPAPPIPQTGGNNPLAVTVALPANVRTAPTPGPNFDGTKVKISNAPQRQYTAFSRWTYKPELSGVEELDQLAPGWKTEYFLKDRPLGMSVDDGVVTWNSDSHDFETLKRGEKFNVELIVKGYWKGPEGARKDLFSVSKNFMVSTQFGYELGPEIDLGLAPDARNIFMTCFDVNNDGLRDILLAEGTLGRGSVRVALSGPDGARQSFMVAEGSRFSSACPLPADEKRNAGVLATDWQKGELSVFVTKGSALEKKHSVVCAPGLVSSGTLRLPDGKLLVASLSNVAGSLFLVPYDLNIGFGKPVVVPMAGGGGNGSIIAWTSADLGPGFLVITPLAEDPLRFVPIKGDEWTKPGTLVVQSPLHDEGVITAAARLNATAGQPPKLAIVLGGKSSLVMLLDEKSGKFTSTGAHAVLPGVGLGLAVADFNKDGSDDLFVTTHDEGCFFFVGADGLIPGPSYSNPGMLGPVVLLNGPRDSRPEIAVLNENKKARFFKPTGSDPVLMSRTVDAVTEGTPKVETAHP